MSGRRGHEGGRGRLGSGRGRGGKRNFNRSKNNNNKQELKFYLHRTGPDQQTASCTKVKEHLILNNQSEFVNVSEITESICKGVISYSSKEIPIKIISKEEEPIRA